MERTVLAIAATDSLARAGLFVDLQTIRDHGWKARGVVSAITAQDDRGFLHQIATPPDLFRDQLRVVTDAGLPSAVKIGALPDLASLELVGHWLVDAAVSRVVIDPVFESSAGCDLLAADAFPGYRDHFIQNATLLTPNLPEIERLVGRQLTDRLAVEAAADTLLATGVEAVLVKGGHAPWLEGADLLAHGSRRIWLEGTHLAGVTLRGSGCKLASAIACGLAAGESLEEAVIAARQWLAPHLAAAAGE